MLNFYRAKIGTRGGLKKSQKSCMYGFVGMVGGESEIVFTLSYEIVFLGLENPLVINIQSEF